jgi:hypothetical protein
MATIYGLGILNASRIKNEGVQVIRVHSLKSGIAIRRESPPA